MKQDTILVALCSHVMNVQVYIKGFDQTQVYTLFTYLYDSFTIKNTCWWYVLPPIKGTYTLDQDLAEPVKR
jgi:hypothetical protein